MNERLAALLQQVRTFWASLTMPKKVALVGSMAGVVAIVLAVSFSAPKESYGFLFTELGPEDAASITAKLKELKVPYRLEAGGSAIQVPEEKVHELRLEIAGQGLPRGGGVGFEIFDKTHLGATEFEQRIHLRRALEGELVRTIGTLGAVQSTRVHLVLPERSVFAVAKENASASVVLKLRPGHAFTKREVASVVHLVTAAVPGLTESRVSVVSAEGLTLHRPKPDGQEPGGGTDDEDASERNRAQIAATVSSLEDKARGMLERIVGPGHADVRVGLEVEQAVRERTEEHFDPAKTVLRSEQRLEEKTGGEGETVAGVPGAQSNLPNGTAEPPTTTPIPGGSKLTQTRNWEVDRVTEKTSMPAGRTLRLSVAVLIDGQYKTAGSGREFVARDRAELDRLGELVKGAVGFNGTRGDSIQVECAQFAGLDDAPTAPVEDVSVLAKKRTLPWLIGAGAGVLLTAAAIAVVMRRRAKEAAARAKAAADAAAAEEAAELALPEATAEAARLLESERETKDRARDMALDIASRDPATAAIILREWLNASTIAGSAQA